MLDQASVVDLSDVFEVPLSCTYIIENAKVITQVYKKRARDDIINGLKIISDTLDQYQQKYMNKTLRLCFSSESELYTILVKILGAEMMNNMQVRKVRD